MRCHVSSVCDIGPLWACLFSGSITKKQLLERQVIIRQRHKKSSLSLYIQSGFLVQL